MKERFPNTGPENPDRRKFLRDAIVAAGAGALLNASFPTKLGDGEKTVARDNQSELMEQAQTTFEGYLKSLEVKWTMTPDSVVFTDEYGQSLGVFPIDQCFVEDEKKIEAIGHDGRFTGAWIKKMREEIATQHQLDPSSLTMLHVVQDFSAARESVSAEDFASFNSITDIARYHSKQPAALGAEQSRLECLQTDFPKHLDIPDPLIKELLCEHVVGLVAKESKFNDELGKNKFTAQQALQLTDAVRIEHLYTRNSELSDEENKTIKKEVADRRLPFPLQVEVAAKHFSNIYKRIPHWLQHGQDLESGKEFDRPEVYGALRSCFESEEDWKRYMLFPLMINAYNGGSLLIGDACASFVQAHGDSLQEKAKSLREYDLYFAISRHARESGEGRLVNYGPDSSSYVANTIAATRAFTGSSQS